LAAHPAGAQAGAPQVPASVEADAETSGLLSVEAEVLLVEDPELPALLPL
jgi:hypothetical protein